MNNNRKSHVQYVNSESAWLNFESPSNLLNTKERKKQWTDEKIALKIIYKVRFLHSSHNIVKWTHFFFFFVSYSSERKINLIFNRLYLAGSILIQWRHHKTSKPFQSKLTRKQWSDASTRNTTALEPWHLKDKGYDIQKSLHHYQHS